ncbi:hypothetical protein [Fodinicola feengrottensis]|uniref:Sigma-70 family RNA polymerase sigma factor n=1 Tax=Fodinicola feengrottensis TaxID=435914 RepID=A0ABP4UB51_9ACTN|nr:hypothetical protein [Fodinicola feengrottensis]
MTERIRVNRRIDLTPEETPKLLQAAAARDDKAVSELVSALEPIAWQRAYLSARKLPELLDDFYACGLLAVWEAIADETTLELGRLIGGFNIHYRRLAAYLIANHRTKGAGDSNVFRTDRQSERTRVAADLATRQAGSDHTEIGRPVFGSADSDNARMEEALQQALSAGVLASDEFRAVRIWSGMETGRKTSEKLGGPRMGISEWEFRRLKDSALESLREWSLYFYAESLDNELIDR